jgi:hypothetical protein
MARKHRTRLRHPAQTTTMNKLIEEIKTAIAETPRLYFQPITATVGLLKRLFTVKAPRP